MLLQQLVRFLKDNIISKFDTRRCIITIRDLLKSKPTKTFEFWNLGLGGSIELNLAMESFSYPLIKLLDSC